MLLEAVLSIQAGDNPRMLGEKLETFIPPYARGAQPTPGKPGAGADDFNAAEAAA